MASPARVALATLVLAGAPLQRIDAQPLDHHLDRAATATADALPSPHDRIVASALTLLAGMCVYVPSETRIGLVRLPVERGPTSVRVSAYWDGGAIWVNVLSAEYEAVEDGDVIALAGVLAHESYHARHGGAEAPAYNEQIRVLKLLRASRQVVAAVERARAARTHAR